MIQPYLAQRALGEVVRALSLRAFIAIDIEDPDVLKRLTDFQMLLTGTGSELKLVEPGNIHITLWFLGNITPGLADRICAELKAIQFEPFEVELVGVGAFPSLNRPRVIWAGIRRGSDELVAIYEQLKKRLRGLGFRPDPKGFTPHVTLARVKRWRPELPRLLSENLDLCFGSFRAEEVRLKRSVLTPKGPIYSTICSTGPSE